MAEKRKDSRGRNLKTGEYYDSKNKRYMFRKMIDGSASQLPLLIWWNYGDRKMICCAGLTGAIS